jgi:segregation and condensation protein B
VAPTPPPDASRAGDAAPEEPPPQETPEEAPDEAPEKAPGDAPGEDDAPARAPDDHALEEAAEAIIFAADEPVEAERIADIVAEVTGRAPPSVDEVDEAVDRLNAEYRETDRALHIHRWAGGFRMATRDSLSPFVKALFVGEQETSLSRSLLETLAVVAYRQPVTRPEVDFIRGVNSDYAIRKLLEMNLVDVNGRADTLGRPLLYGTTDRFLEQFGLEGTDDLPTLREVKEILDDPAFDEERAKLLKLDAEEAAKVREAAEGEDLEDILTEHDVGPSEGNAPPDAPS